MRKSVAIRTGILSLTLLAGFAAAAESAKKAEEVKIPADAVRIDANTSRYTDSQGRTWIYRRTPFGVRRYEEKAAPAPPDSKPAKPGQETPVGISVREEGEVLHFERPTPFGVRRWSRKKSELTEDEKLVWEQARKSPAESKKKIQDQKGKE